MLRIWKNFTSTGTFENTICGTTSQSKLFLRKIRKFNSCFQMTSFGATKIVHNEDGHNFESTFKIQGQMYHRIGSLFPMPDTDPKFLQIYFMGDVEQQIHIRCVYNHIEHMEEREIVDILEMFLQNHNQLLRLFKTLSNRLQNDYFIVIMESTQAHIMFQLLIKLQLLWLVTHVNVEIFAYNVEIIRCK